MSIWNRIEVKEALINSLNDILLFRGAEAARV
jgi:hypothetical protein